VSRRDSLDRQLAYTGSALVLHARCFACSLLMLSSQRELQQNGASLCCEFAALHSHVISRPHEKVLVRPLLQSAVDITRLGANLQYGRVPASLVGPAVSGLLGLLNIR